MGKEKWEFKHLFPWRVSVITIDCGYRMETLLAPTGEGALSTLSLLSYFCHKLVNGNTPLEVISELTFVAFIQGDWLLGIDRILCSPESSRSLLGHRRYKHDSHICQHSAAVFHA